MKFRELVENWPDTSMLAADCGVSYFTAASWKRRGGAPSNYWPAIVASAKRRGIKGVTPELLLAIDAKRVLAKRGRKPAPGKNATQRLITS